MSNSEDYLDSLLAEAMEQNYREGQTEPVIPRPSTDAVSDEADAGDSTADISMPEADISDLTADISMPEAATDDLMADSSISEDAINDLLSDISEDAYSKPDLNMSIADAMLENLSIEDALNRENGIADIQDIKDSESAAMENMDFSLEEIEQRLAMASDISDKDDINKRVEDMDVTEAIDELSIEDLAIQDIGQMLKKSDEGELVDPSIIEAKEERIRALEAEEMEKERMADSQEESKFNEGADKDMEVAENATDEDSGRKGKKKKKEKDKKEKKGGLKALLGLFGKKKADQTSELAMEAAVSGASALEDDIDSILARLDDSGADKAVDSTSEQVSASGETNESTVNTGAMAQQQINILQDELSFADQSLEDEINSPDAGKELNLDQMLSEAAGEFGKGEAGDNQESLALEDDATVKPQAAETTSEEEETDKKKKPGFFAKLLSMLTEEVEEEETEDKAKADGQEGNGLVSAENQAILDELDAEEDGKKKGKKKKEKKPKEKKEKKPKPKKEKKPKDKVKDTGKKLSKKYISVSACLGISIFVAIMLITSYVPELMNMSSARDAYYKGDYDDAFITMYGKDLNESDQLIYDRSKTIILLERKLDSYHNYKAMGMDFQALNALFSGLIKYEELKDDAAKLEVLDKITLTRLDILNELSAYGVSEAEAMEVIAYSDMDYTLKLQAILAGEPYTLRNDEIRARYGLGTTSGAPVDGDDESTDGDATSGEGSSQTGLLLEGMDGQIEDVLPEEEAYRAGEIIPEEVNVPDAQSQQTGNPSSVQTSDNVTVIVESQLFN